MTAAERLLIEGSVSDGFESVREAFVENFTRRGELGAACCIYRYGEMVVDLWGGVRDRVSGEPWHADTMVLVHSTTKGLSAMVLALAHSRGWLDYDDRVCSYWPEFAEAGKERIAVRQLLAHQAGLFAFDEKVDRDVVADPDRLAGVLARQRPVWEPGERQAYHAISLGFYESELIRRIDPQHRSLGRFFDEEIAAPLGVEFYIGLPESIPDARLAPLEPPSLWKRLTSMPPKLMVAAMNKRSVLYRSLVANPGTGFYVDERGVVVRNLEVPSGGGVGNARGIAKAYGVFASGGHELGLKSETLALLEAPALPSRHGFFDECFRAPAKFSLGFMKPSESFPFGHASAFGAPGAGGSMGYADPEVGIGYGYVTNRMGMDLQGDPRDVALRRDPNQRPHTLTTRWRDVAHNNAGAAPPSTERAHNAEHLGAMPCFGDCGGAIAAVSADNIRCERDTFVFEAPVSPTEYLTWFRDYYGPTMNAFEAAESSGRADELFAELDTLFNEKNTNGDPNTTVIPATFLCIDVRV